MSTQSDARLYISEPWKNKFQVANQIMMLCTRSFNGKSEINLPVPYKIRQQRKVSWKELKYSQYILVYTHLCDSRPTKVPADKLALPTLHDHCVLLADIIVQSVCIEKLYTIVHQVGLQAVEVAIVPSVACIVTSRNYVVDLTGFSSRMNSYWYN